MPLPTEPIIDPSLEPFYEPPVPEAPAPTPAPVPSGNGVVAPPDAPAETPSYDPRTPERAKESGVPWLGVPPGVEVKAVPGGTPIITKAPTDYVPPPGYVLSKELTEARKPKLVGKQPFGKLPPPPSPDEQAKLEVRARELKIDPFAYVQQQWMLKHNLTPQKVAESGQILPGITTSVKVAGIERVIPVPLPGTLAEPYDESKTHLQVYGVRGQLISVSRQTLWSMQHTMSEPQRINKMAELGILPKDTKAIQLTVLQLMERGLSKAKAESLVEQGKNWGYERRSDIEAQRLITVETEQTLAQEAIYKEALAKLEKFKVAPAWEKDPFVSTVKIKDVGTYDVTAILDAGKEYEKSAITLFGARQMSLIKSAKTEFESRHTRLPDGEWMLNADLTEVKSNSPLAYKILTTEGYGAYQKANKKALTALKNYQDPKTKGYFVSKAVAQNVEKKHLNLLFGRIVIEETEPESMIPSSFPSDAEYAKLTLQQKNELGKRGDLRRKWAKITWEEAQRLEDWRGKGLMTKPAGKLTGKELQEIIAFPYENVALAVRSIEPFQQPWANKILKGIAQGTGDAIVGMAMLPVIAGGLTGMGLKDPQSASKATWQVGSGMLSWGKHTITQMWRDPASGVPYAVITLGPMAYTGFKTATWAGKKIIITVHPKGIPMSLIGKEFSAGRIPINALDTADLGRAVGKALEKSMEVGLGPKGKASGTVTEGGITVQYLKTPYQMEVGNALWHGTSDIRFLETEAGFFAKLNKEAGRAILSELHNANVPAIRKFNLSNAVNVPKKVAKSLTELLKTEKAKVYGSFTEWLFNKTADKPMDFDIAVTNPAKTIKEIIQICKDAGIPAKKVTHGVAIEKAGEWIKLCDVVSLTEHNKLRPAGYKVQQPVLVDGVRVEKIGEQLSRRGNSLLKTGAKGRLKDLPKFIATAKELARRLKPELSGKLLQFASNIDISFRVKGTGEPGLYFNPYAAEYFAQGKDPGFILLLTDTAKLKEVPTEALGRVSQSDWYISGKKKGLHEPSKSWKGAFETEIVAAPETQFTMPFKAVSVIKVGKQTLIIVKKGVGEPLVQRLFGGNVRDFFTMNREGKFLPIRIAYDKGVTKIPPTSAELYAIKLHTISNSLENFKEAVAHPGRALKDIIKGRPGPKGLRELEVTNVDLKTARNFEAIRTRLELEAKRATDHRVKGKKIAEDSPQYQKIYQEELKRAFDREGKRLQREYGKQVEEAYRHYPERFEDIYRYHLERTFRAFIRHRIITKGARELITKARVEQRADVVRRLQTVERIPEARRTTEQRREIARLRELERGLIAIVPRTKRTVVMARKTIPTAREVKRVVPEREPAPREVPLRELVPRETPRREPIPREPIRERKLITVEERLLEEEKKEKKKVEKKVAGAIAWRQGFVWWVIYPPYKSKADVKVFYKNPPPGVTITKGKGSAYKTIQALGGEASVLKHIDLGIMDIVVDRPHRVGARGTIRYKRDVKQRTKGEISLTGVRV